MNTQLLGLADANTIGANTATVNTDDANHNPQQIAAPPQIANQQQIMNKQLPQTTDPMY
jgi:hypothetical protein